MSELESGALRVFISYRRFHGGLAYASILHQRLTEAGVSCFLDVESMRDYSDDFDLKINRELSTSDYVVVLLQPGCMREREDQEDFFLKELRLAHRVGVPLVCLPIDPSFRWEIEQLPDDLAFMAKLNFAAILRADEPDEATEALLRRFDDGERNRRPLLFHRSLHRARQSDHTAVLQTNAQIIATDIEERWAHATRVSLLAIGCQGIIKRFRSVLVKKYREGVRFRFVSVDPQSSVAEDIVHAKLNSHRLPGRRDYLTESMETCVEVLTDIGRNRSNGGSIEYRVTPYAPTCTIQWIECDNPADSYIYVELLPMYGPDTRQDLNIAFLVRSSDPAYDYYAQQFSACWERSAVCLKVGGRGSCEYCDLMSRTGGTLLEAGALWAVHLADNQNYPGRLIVVLKRHAGSLAELTTSEWEELQGIVKRCEQALAEVAGATCVNWTCLMNSGFATKPYDPHVHLHAIPRFDHDLVEYSEPFRDGLFGSHYTLSTEYQLPGTDRTDLAGRLRAHLAASRESPENQSSPSGADTLSLKARQDGSSTEEIHHD